ncbi:MAG: pyridoxal phosphate-dependent aminotransferase family protein, partial [Calditerrivibrio sp.]|nr:pyridoxal phosphate-dependent aminotransferase family protein [Calditerrivibrio sp.]
NHASIVDGIRLSSAEHIRYRHFDYDYIEEYLLNNREKYENVFIVTESLFSMDGDIADLKRLADIKNRFDCFLYVDEAHSVGVYGDGKGLAYEFGVIDDVDIFVGTFGKAFSSIGGFVSTNDLFHQLIVNHSRTLIFTTALPPVVINWNNFILSKMGEFGNKRGILFDNTRIISDKIKASGLKTAGNSCIVPVIVGESVKAKALSDYLKKEGILAPAIRPPTVLEGTSRIRISVNPLISLSDIEELESKILKWVGDYEH